MEMAAAPAPEMTIRTSSFRLPYHLQGVGQARQSDDGGAVLVVVEDGDVAQLLQAAAQSQSTGVRRYPPG